MGSPIASIGGIIAILLGLIFVPALRRRAVQSIGLMVYMMIVLVNATALFPLVVTVVIVIGLLFALPLEFIMRVIGLRRVRPMEQIMTQVRRIFWSYARPVMNSLMVAGTDNRHNANRSLPNWDELILSMVAIIGTFSAIFYLKIISNDFFAHLGFKPLIVTFNQLHLSIPVTPFWVLDFMFYGFPLLIVIVAYLKFTGVKGNQRGYVWKPASTPKAQVANKKSTSTNAVVKTDKVLRSKASPVLTNGQIVPGAQVVMQNGQYMVVLPLMGQVATGSTTNNNGGLKQRDDRQTIQDWVEAEQAGKENYWHWGIAPVQGRQKAVAGKALADVVAQAEKNRLSGEVIVSVFNAAKTDKVYYQTEISMADLKVEAQSELTADEQASLQAYIQKQGN